MWKWEEHHFTTNRPGPDLPCKISDRGVKRIQKSCLKAKEDLQRPTEKRKSVNHHGLHERSPCNTQFLKKKHVEFKVAEQHLDKPVIYWETIVWSKLTFDTIIHTMLRGQRALHIFRGKRKHQKHHTNNEAWNWEHHGVGCFSAYGTGTLHVISGRMNGNRIQTYSRSDQLSQLWAKDDN